MSNILDKQLAEIDELPEEIVVTGMRAMSMACLVKKRQA